MHYFLSFLLSILKHRWLLLSCKSLDIFHIEDSRSPDDRFQPTCLIVSTHCLLKAKARAVRLYYALEFPLPTPRLTSTFRQRQPNYHFLLYVYGISDFISTTPAIKFPAVSLPPPDTASLDAAFQPMSILITLLLLHCGCDDLHQSIPLPRLQPSQCGFFTQRFELHLWSPLLYQ